MQRIKIEKNTDYTIISNVFLRDKNISLKAKGFLALIMSLPPDWDFSGKGIISIVKEGETSVYSTINELIENGYCNRQKITEKGKFAGYEYTFFEKPNQQKPDLENPNSEKPNQQKQEQIKKEESNKDEIIKDILMEESEIPTQKLDKNKVEKFVPPTLQELNLFLQAYCQTKGLNWRDFEIESEKFINFYTNKKWKVGKEKMIDWQAAARNWILNSKNYQNGTSKSKSDTSNPYSIFER